MQVDRGSGKGDKRVPGLQGTRGGQAGEGCLCEVQGSLELEIGFLRRQGRIWTEGEVAEEERPGRSSE